MYVVIPSFELYIRDPPPINFVFTHSIQNFKVDYMQVLIVIFFIKSCRHLNFFLNFSLTFLHKENLLHINRGLINY